MGELFRLPSMRQSPLRQVLLEAWERKEGRGGGGERRGRGWGGGGGQVGRAKTAGKGGGGKSREAGPGGGKRTQKRGRSKQWTASADFSCHHRPLHEVVWFPYYGNFLN